MLEKILEPIAQWIISVISSLGYGGIILTMAIESAFFPFPSLIILPFFRIFISRLLPVIRTFISLPAGIARMNFTKFVIYTFVGSFFWCLGLAYVGKVMGANWELIKNYVRGADIFIVVLIVAGVIFFFFRANHTGYFAQL